MCFCRTSMQVSIPIFVTDSSFVCGQRFGALTSICSLRRRKHAGRLCHPGLISYFMIWRGGGQEQFDQPGFVQYQYVLLCIRPFCGPRKQAFIAAVMMREPSISRKIADSSHDLYVAGMACARLTDQPMAAIRLMYKKCPSSLCKLTGSRVDGCIIINKLINSHHTTRTYHTPVCTTQDIPHPNAN